MSDGTQPTLEQKEWLAGVLGPQVWGELKDRPDFQAALGVSLEEARRIALRHMADRSRTGHAFSQVYEAAF